MLNHRLTSCDEPVTALASLPVGGAFRYWRGRSGRRYLHTVYALTDWPGYAQANVIFVARQGDHRNVVWIGRADGDGDSDGDMAALMTRMTRLGATEVHVHLLAGSLRARTAVEADLRAAQPIMRLVK